MNEGRLAVVLERLEAFCFRNLGELQLELHPRFNLVQGENAQGKTNLLEAVAVLSNLSSFRARRVEELLRFGSSTSRVKGVVRDGGERSELEVELRVGGRRALIGGKATRGAASYLRILPTVLFWPEDLYLPRGSPSDRRRLLDRAVATIWPGYLALARDYQRSLLSRNRVLREAGERSSNNDALLEVYERQLSEIGGKMVAARVRFLRNFAPTFGSVFSKISRSGVVGTLCYRTRAEVVEAGDRVGSVSEVLLRLFRETRSLDLARRATSVGPHVDDLEFQLDQRSTRCFGSQGQLRALVLGFKIAQIIDGFQKLGRYPVLLLDDVSSELDPKRNRYLFEFIETIEAQVFLTTTLGASLPVPKERLNFQVVNGEIATISEA